MAGRKSRHGLTRREFLRGAMAAAVGAASGLRALAASAPNKAALPELKRRVLGRTGLQVSQLGMGTSISLNVAVVQRALDMGVNFFDTAECYENGNAEIALGEAFACRREEVIIATKWHTNGTRPADSLLASLDGSLKRLNMEHVDLIQVHGAEKPEQVTSDELWEAFTRAREAGKARFNGVSLHDNHLEVARAAIKTGRFNALLIPHNPLISETVTPVLQEAAQAGLGVITMKALQPVHAAPEPEALKGLCGNVYQRAIQWALRSPHVSAVIVEMPTFEELEEDVRAASTAASEPEVEEFEEAVASIAVGSCHLCGRCTRQCPAGVRVAEVMRYWLYHQGYGQHERAAALYRRLPARESAATCSTCQPLARGESSAVGKCKAICPWGVPIRERMQQAHALLAGERANQIVCDHRGSA